MSLFNECAPAAGQNLFDQYPAATSTAPARASRRRPWPRAERRHLRDVRPPLALLVAALATTLAVVLLSAPASDKGQRVASADGPRRQPSVADQRRDRSIPQLEHRAAHRRQAPRHPRPHRPHRPRGASAGADRSVSPAPAAAQPVAPSPSPSPPPAAAGVAAEFGIEG